MKKRLGTGITLFVALIFVLINLPASPAWAEPGDVEINETNFPDGTFRDYVKTNFDTDSSGILSQTELDAVRDVDVRDKNITTLKGVEHFTNLKLLHCGSNQLSSLDVRQNTLLEMLYCSENQLTDLDVTQNTALETLVCYNNQLTDLDVSNNTKLAALACHQNKLTALDLSQNPDLTDLDCSENKLTSLNCTNNANLTSFEGGNQKADIFVANNTLTFDLTSLPGFDPSKASGWSTGTVSEGVLNLNTKPPTVTYSYEASSGHNLSVTLKVSYDDLVTIRFDKNGGTGDMADASVGKGIPYTLPACGFTPPAGKTFRGWQVNGAPQTVGSSITVTKDTTVKALWKKSSPIPGKVEINATTFPDKNFRTYVSKEFDKDEDGSLSQVERDMVQTISVGKKDIRSLEGLEYFRNLTYLYCSENQLTSLDVGYNPALEELSCYKNQLTSLDVSQNPALEYLNCGDNQLTGLDVRQNPALTWLECSVNQLTSLDVGQNRALKTLTCDTNQLTSLDVSQNTALENLYCHYNRLTSLDCKSNTKISKFNGANQEYNIQVDGNHPTFDLPEGFESSKARFRQTYQGLLVSGTTLNFTGKQYSTVVYRYDARDGRQLDVTLKVRYRVTVSFDKNGGSGNMADVTAYKNEPYTLPDCDFTAPDGKTFKAWEVDGKEYAAGEDVTIKGDTTVKAIWAEPSKPSKPNEGASAGTVTKPQEPQKPDEEKPAVVGSSAAYLTGYPDGSIRPNGFVTRAESAKIIASLKGLDLSAGGQPAFKDLASSWYTPYINAVVKQGLMRGYMDGTFKPNAPITRAEFAQMIMPLDKAIEARAPFTDVKGHWAEKAINQAYGNGRIKGYPDGTFRPDGQITRAEAVTICNNLFNRKADKAGLEAALKNPGKIKTFTDLDKSHWAYYEILEAANPHDDQKKA